MRVGLVSPYSWTVPGGVNHHVEHLADELEKRGHETWIIAPVGVVTPARRAVDSRRQAMAERFIPMGSAVPVPSNGSLAYLNFSPQDLCAHGPRHPLQPLRRAARARAVHADGVAAWRC